MVNRWTSAPKAAMEGFTLLEVVVAMVVSAVALVALLGALSCLWAVEVRLREASLATIRIWSRTERIRAGDSPEGSERRVVSPALRPLKAYAVEEDGVPRWEVWRDD